MSARTTSFSVPELRDLPLFASCSKNELSRARSLLTPVTVPAGQLLWKSGVYGSDFAIIADGELAVSDADGTRIAVLGRNDIVGELALLDGMPRNASVMTLTPAVLFVGNTREFFGLLHLVPSLREQVLRGAVERREQAA